MDRTWVEQQLATMESREADYAQRISIATYLVKHISQTPDPLEGCGAPVTPCLISHGIDACRWTRRRWQIASRVN